MATEYSKALGVELPLWPGEVEGMGYFNRDWIAAVLPAADAKRCRLVLTGVVPEFIIDLPISEVVRLIRI